jgi:hypothetical protein
MTIKEMHIAFDQGVQYIASNKSRGFYPEEKDLILNKMINRYIISRVRPKEDGSFEMDNMAAEQLKTLLTSATIAAEIKGNMYEVVLPSDLGWFISASAGVVDYSCRSILPTPTAGTKYVHSMILPISSKSTAKYYEAATLLGSAITTLASERGATWTGVPAKEQRFSVFTPLIQKLRREGHEIYVGKNPITMRGDINQYKIWVINNSATLLTATSDATSVNSAVEAVTFSKYTETPERYSPVRLIKTGYAFQLQNTPYLKSTVHSPTGHLLGNILQIQGSLTDADSYIVSGSQLFYLRKPALVSLSLGLTSDLPEEYHEEIVDLAVTYAKGELNSPDWERKLTDLKLNTTAV